MKSLESQLRHAPLPFSLAGCFDEERALGAGSGNNCDRSRNGSKRASSETRKATRSRASGSPSPGEGRTPEHPGHRRTVGHLVGGSKGSGETIGLEDILIIAPYYAQVFDLKVRMPGARVGTVDKFQGQEAPIVIYSMTTSTHADAPRSVNFLYSLNRLNAATSRAKALSILVCAPQLFEPVCQIATSLRDSL